MDEPPAANDRAHTPSTLDSEDYPSNSDDYSARPPRPTGSSDYRDDSEGYRDDNEGYRDDRVGYSDPPAESADREDYDGDSGAYQVFSDTTRSDDPVGGWMPDDALAATVTGTDGLEPGRRDWQVNVRLDYNRYTRLVRAADLYGTPPTTMARMLINRGAEAVINAHRAEVQLLRGTDEEG